MTMVGRYLHAVLGLIAIVLAAIWSAGVVQAEDGMILVPALTIYPGDVIKEEWLVERPFSNSVFGTGAFVESRHELIGKVARRTLLPGRPIPANAIGERKIVTNGGMVKVVFEEGGLTIVTYAAALQAGAVGDIISVRNLDSGVIISGVVQADGSVRVSQG